MTFPLELPSAADLEQAAQLLEKDVEYHKEGARYKAAAGFAQAAATYRLIFEIRMAREDFQNAVKKLGEKSIFERVFGPTFGPLR